MNRYIRAACVVLVFVVMASISFPFQSFDIMASDTNFVYVTVMDNHFLTYKTGAKSVGAFLKEYDIYINDRDRCSHSFQDLIQDGMLIHIIRGLPFTVTINGVSETRTARPGTLVGAFILQLQNELETALVYEGDAEREITENEELVLLTWQGIFYTEKEWIPYETFQYETKSVRIGKSHVRQEGIFGELEKTTAVVYIGGEAYNIEIINEDILSEPVPEIIDMGAGRIGTKIDVNAADFHYKKKLTMNASAYTAGFQCTGKNPGDPGYGITASGRPVQTGIVAVDRNIIPLGTYLYVEGYGFAIAADVGGAIVGNKIDLYYEYMEDAIRFGRRDLTVFILD